MSEKTETQRPADVAGRLDGLVGAFSVGLAQQKEEALRSITTAILGNGHELESLRGRLCMKIFPGGVEVFCIDGKEVVEFQPIRYEQTVCGGAVEMKATQNYKVLSPNAGIQTSERSEDRLE